ncbi:MAG: tRNA (adenosine(37)-N6)-threonylcarbamoyltransferase complex dimerization subunit type 1 TsaB [Polyangia bacterium]|jgi:tRNA threonylcarbamoyladenosine biosynthesis protein TsaB
MRPVLAFDTSTPCARVAALSPTGDCLAMAEKVAARHSSNLLRLCDEVLRATGVTVANLAAIACGAGPGSFTGLRVGLAVAKGLALADRIPLVLVSSLDALAADLAGFGGESLVLPCIDAGKGQVYGRLYRVAGQAPAPISTDEIALRPDDVCRAVQEQAAGAAVVAGGNGVDRYQDVFRAQLGAQAVRFQVAGPSALAVGRLALARLARGEHDDLETSVPRYGRPPDITKPKAAPRTSAR